MHAEQNGDRIVARSAKCVRSAEHAESTESIAKGFYSVSDSMGCDRQLRVGRHSCPGSVLGNRSAQAEGGRTVWSDADTSVFHALASEVLRRRKINLLYVLGVGRRPCHTLCTRSWKSRSLPVDSVVK